MAKRRARYRGKKKTHFKNSGYGEGGASSTIKSMKQYWPRQYSAKSDINAVLGTLRNRASDLSINTPIGAAAINRSSIHAVGSGLKAFPRPNYRVLGITADEAREWSRKVSQEFELWAQSTECDIIHRNNFYDMQWIAYQRYLIDGDHFVIIRRKNPTPNMPYSLRLQLLEGNRVSNPIGYETFAISDSWAVEMINSDNGNSIINGVEIDKYGAVVAYWVSNNVPGDPTETHEVTKWARVEAFGANTGYANVLQICHDVRAGQYRGVPYLAPVIETLKQVSRYTTAELTSAIVKSFFSLFFTAKDSTTGDLNDYLGDPLKNEDDPLEPVVNPAEYSLGPGTLNALPKGVDVKSVDASNAQSTFGVFEGELIKQLAAALSIPSEVLMGTFTSSYSASRAALLQAWEEFKLRRSWFARDFCQPIYELWLVEAVATGRIEAPGFFDDPMIRSAWVSCNWFGPTMSILDPQKDVQGSMLRVQNGLSTREREAMEMTGSDFEDNLDQLAYEEQIINSHNLKAVTMNAALSQQVTPVVGTEAGQEGGEDEK